MFTLRCIFVCIIRDADFNSDHYGLPAIICVRKFFFNLLHCVDLIRSTSVTNQILLSEKLKVGQIERGVFQEETSARNAKNTLLIARYH